MSQNKPSQTPKKLTEAQKEKVRKIAMRTVGGQKGTAERLLGKSKKFKKLETKEKDATLEDVKKMTKLERQAYFLKDIGGKYNVDFKTEEFEHKIGLQDLFDKKTPLLVIEDRRGESILAEISSKGHFYSTDKGQRVAIFTGYKIYVPRPGEDMEHFQKKAKEEKQIAAMRRLKRRKFMDKLKLAGDGPMYAYRESKRNPKLRHLIRNMVNDKRLPLQIHPSVPSFWAVVHERFTDKNNKNHYNEIYARNFDNYKKEENEAVAIANKRKSKMEQEKRFADKFPTFLIEAALIIREKEFNIKQPGAKEYLQKCLALHKKLKRKDAYEDWLKTADEVFNKETQFENRLNKEALVAYKQRNNPRVKKVIDKMKKELKVGPESARFWDYLHARLTDSSGKNYNEAYAKQFETQKPDKSFGKTSDSDNIAVASIERPKK